MKNTAKFKENYTLYEFNIYKFNGNILTELFVKNSPKMININMLIIYMTECCVCLEDYNKDNFKIKCNHDLCCACYAKLEVKLCPYCRQQIKHVYTGNQKGKLNLNKYSKILRHLQYKYKLQGRRKNEPKDNLYHSLRLLYGTFPYSYAGYCLKNKGLFIPVERLDYSIQHLLNFEYKLIF